MNGFLFYCEKVFLRKFLHSFLSEKCIFLSIDTFWFFFSHRLKFYDDHERLKLWSHTCIRIFKISNWSYLEKKRGAMVILEDQDNVQDGFDVAYWKLQNRLMASGTRINTGSFLDNVQDSNLDLTTLRSIQFWYRTTKICSSSFQVKTIVRLR